MSPPKIDSYPGDRTFCDTSGQQLINGCALADLDHCHRCHELILAENGCNCETALHITNKTRIQILAELALRQNPRRSHVRSSIAHGRGPRSALLS